VFCNVSIVESINFNFKFWSSFFLFLFQLLLILNLWLRLELFLQFITFLILNSRLWFIFIDFQFTDILWLIPINFTYFNSIIFIRGLKNILFLFFLFLILLSNSWFQFLWLHLIWLSNFNLWQVLFCFCDNFFFLLWCCIIKEWVVKLIDLNIEPSLLILRMLKIISCSLLNFL